MTKLTDQQINDMIPVDAGMHQEDRRDWLLDGASDMMDRIRKYAPTSDYQYEWNQSSTRQTRAFCTAVAPMCVILSYKQKSRGEQQWLDFWQYAVDNFGYVEGQGHWMQTGTKCAISYRNMHHPDEPLVYFNVGWNTPEFHEVRKLGYRLVIGGKFNRNYILDYARDGLVDAVASWKTKPFTYGHIRTLHGEDAIEYIDNYEGRRYNRYKIDESTLSQVVRDYDPCGHYPTAYVITDGRTITRDRLPFDLAKQIQTMMTASSLMWNKIHESIDIAEGDKKKAKDILHTFNQSWRDEFDF